MKANGRPRAGRWGAVVAVLAIAVFASGCAFLRPIPGTSGLARVVVGPPGAGGARVVDVSVPGLAPGTPAEVTIRVDRPVGPATAAATQVPATIELPGAALAPGQHTVWATVRVGKRFAIGATRVSGALRLNQVLALGSHNSYHVAPVSPPWSNVPQWQYTHSPLDVQFESEGVRQIELDVYVDANGTRVLHITDVDFGTTCATLVVCLQTVKGWSDAHPQHFPIAILVELKDDDIGLPTPVYPWDGPAMDVLDAEIRSVFGPADLLTPDDVRRGRATLSEAVTTLGWPTIDSVRGKVLFAMDNSGSYRNRYLAGHPVLEGRVLFTNSTPGAPDGGFVKLNNAIGDQSSIRAAVTAGYLVRTRADGDTVEARANDTTVRDAALASGAQWVSTDFPVPGRAFGTPY
ncbi:MAG: Ca2+-dependent phosphoinositide-specific phospholipase C, partial [Acidimicrobiia bacterium]